MFMFNFHETPKLFIIFMYVMYQVPKFNLDTRQAQ